MLAYTPQSLYPPKYTSSSISALFLLLQMLSVEHREPPPDPRMADGPPRGGKGGHSRPPPPGPPPGGFFHDYPERRGPPIPRPLGPPVGISSLSYGTHPFSAFLLIARSTPCHEMKVLCVAYEIVESAAMAQGFLILAEVALPSETVDGGFLRLVPSWRDWSAGLLSLRILPCSCP